MATAFDSSGRAQEPLKLIPGILDVATFQLSGGSTSLPKIIPRMHGEYLGATFHLSQRYQLTGDDVTLGACHSSTTPARSLRFFPWRSKGERSVLQPASTFPKC